MLRMQLQKIHDAMLRVRRNALNYSVADYDVLLKENMEAISHTKIPYALILSKQELRVLEQQGKEIYTSFPIII